MDVGHDLRCDADAMRQRHIRAYMDTDKERLQKREDDQKCAPYVNHATSSPNHLITVELSAVMNEDKIINIKRGSLDHEAKGDKELNRQSNL